MPSENVVCMKNINKHYGGIYALRDVSLTLTKGTVHALVGENGAGKSTLIKILSGVVRKDQGSIEIFGKETEINDYHHSQELGIALVPQELALVEYFSVSENIYLGREPYIKGTKLIDWKGLHKQTEKLLNELKIELDPRKKVKDLSVSDKQMLVIARILSLNAKVIIMDEPTARLGHHEVDKLIDYIRYLKASGKSIIYISHRIEEIFKIADEVTVLRDGHIVGNMPISEVTKDELIKLMVNRDISDKNGYYKGLDTGKEILRVEDLCRKNIIKNASFNLYQGEVLGFFGIVGSGRTELIRAVLGIDKKDKGDVYLDNRKVNFKSVTDSLQAGIALVPEERRQQGLVLSLSIRTNVTLGSLKRFCKYGFIQAGREKKFVNEMVNRIKLTKRSIEQNASDLSGGNQQKVVLAKQIGRGNIKIMIFDEPTRGIDVGAKSEIYSLICNIANEGTPVIVISSEIPELQAICNRIIIMKNGQVVKSLKREEFCKAENIMNYAIGG